MSNDDKVLLDLNVPLFQKKLFELDAGEVKKVFKTFQKLVPCKISCTATS